MSKNQPDWYRTLDLVTDEWAGFIDKLRGEVARAGQAYLDGMRPLLHNFAKVADTAALAQQAGVAHVLIERAKAQENQSKRIEALCKLAGVTTTELVGLMNQQRGPGGAVDYDAVESRLEAMITPDGAVIKQLATQLATGELAEDTIVNLNDFMAGVFEGDKPQGKERAMLLVQLQWAKEDGNTELEQVILKRLGGEE